LPAGGALEGAAPAWLVLPGPGPPGAGTRRRGGRGMEGRGVARDKRVARDLGAYVCFEDEAGQGLRPPKGRTWAPRGARPVVTVRGAGGGRVSIAGVACYRPGDRPHLFCHLRAYRRRKGEARGVTWQDYRDLIITTHHNLSAPLVLVWDYVARHIIPVLCPDWLCGQRRLAAGVTGGGRLGAAAAGHIMLCAERGCFLYPGEQRGSCPDAG